MNAGAARGNVTGARSPALHVRGLGMCDYRTVWHRMREFTERRTAATVDEAWWLEHPPVFTLGQAGRIEHLRAGSPIEVVHSDRGGQVTYHGPGQLVVYLLYDLKRARLGVRHCVAALEDVVIDVLGAAGIDAARRAGAPGVYVGGAKIAALGLRVRHGRTYHGLALNCDLDLEPFTHIDPCGYPGLEVTRLSDLGLDWGVSGAAARVLPRLAAALGCRLQGGFGDRAPA